MSYHDTIDVDKLKNFIKKVYGNLRVFSYHTGYTYSAMYNAMHLKIGKSIGENMMNNIIDTINRGIKVDKFTIKPTTKIEITYFYKKNKKSS